MTSNGSSDRARVREVANNYAASGYQIFLEPTAAELPPFLPGYRPDFVARRGSDYVLVEVVPSATARDYERYQELAEKVHAHPGWRLDLITTPADELSRLGVEEAPLLTAPDVSLRLHEAELCLQRGDADAALLVAWSGVEALLRLLAQQYAVRFSRTSTMQVISALATEGVISRPQYEALRDAAKVRAAVAHGFASGNVGESAQAAITLGRELLSEASRAT